MSLFTKTNSEHIHREYWKDQQGEKIHSSCVNPSEAQIKTLLKVKNSVGYFLKKPMVCPITAGLGFASVQNVVIGPAENRQQPPCVWVRTETALHGLSGDKRLILSIVRKSDCHGTICYCANSSEAAQKIQ